jgi:hypothetical protein
MVRTRSGLPLSPLEGNTPAAPGTPRLDRTFSFLGPSLFTTVYNPSPDTEYTEQTVDVDKQKEPEPYDVKVHEDVEGQEETNPYGNIDPNEPYFQLLDIMGINRTEHLLPVTCNKCELGTCPPICHVSITPGTL